MVFILACRARITRIGNQLLARGAGIVSSRLRRDHAGVETDERVVSHNGLGNRVVLLVSVDTALQDVDGFVT